MYRDLRRAVCLLIILAFLANTFGPIPVYAQDFSVNQLPVPGTMVGESAPFTPLALKGLVVNPKKPLEFQFIVDTGKGPQDTASVKDQANQLVKYFLAGLTIPEGDLWVNLSPYEKNRMVPEALGETDLGRDLLAQDYILKQLTASLIYPEKDLGKEFWGRVYARAQAQFGTTNIPVNTFNKVWILPDQAQVFEHGAAAYVTKATLKVMLDEDYTALQKHMAVRNGMDSIGANIVRQIVIPEITKEVNTGKSFAPLRQIYQALILAKWYKETIQNGLLDAVYTNKNKVAGVNLNDPTVKEQIYERYLKAYKKGAFNYIKDDPTSDGQVVPRKYFSGGFKWFVKLGRTKNAAMIGRPDGALLALKIDLDAAMNTVGSLEGEGTMTAQLKQFLENATNVFLETPSGKIPLRFFVEKPVGERIPIQVFPFSVNINSKDYRDGIAKYPVLEPLLTTKQDFIKFPQRGSLGQVLIRFDEEGGKTAVWIMANQSSRGFRTIAMNNQLPYRGWIPQTHALIKAFASLNQFSIVAITAGTARRIYRNSLSEDNLRISYVDPYKKGWKLEEIETPRIIRNIFLDQVISVPPRIKIWTDLAMNGPRQRTLFFPDAVDISNNLPSAWTNYTYLNRYHIQWRWLDMNAMPVIIQRAKSEASDPDAPVLQILVAGSSTGEEMAEAYYEAQQSLVAHGEHLAQKPQEKGWRIHVTGIEKDPQIAREAVNKLNGHLPLVWNSRRGLFGFSSVDQARSYVGSIIQTLRRYSEMNHESFNIINQNVFALNPGDIKTPHLVFMNNFLYQNKDGGSSLRAYVLDLMDSFDNAWPKAWFVLKDTIPGLMEHDLTQHQRLYEDQVFFYKPIDRAMKANELVKAIETSAGMRNYWARRSDVKKVKDFLHEPGIAEQLAKRIKELPGDFLDNPASYTQELRRAGNDHRVVRNNLRELFLSTMGDVDHLPQYLNGFLDRFHSYMEVIKMYEKRQEVPTGEYLNKVEENKDGAIDLILAIYLMSKKDDIFIEADTNDNGPMMSQWFSESQGGWLNFLKKEHLEASPDLRKSPSIVYNHFLSFADFLIQRLLSQSSNRANIRIKRSSIVAVLRQNEKLRESVRCFLILAEKIDERYYHWRNDHREELGEFLPFPIIKNGDRRDQVEFLKQALEETYDVMKVDLTADHELSYKNFLAKALGAGYREGLINAQIQSLGDPHTVFADSLNQELVFDSKLPLQFGPGLLYHGLNNFNDILATGHLGAPASVTRTVEEYGNADFNHDNDYPATLVIDSKVFNRYRNEGKAKLTFHNNDPWADFTVPVPLEEVQEIWISEDTWEIYQKALQNPADYPLSTEMLQRLGVLIKENKIKVMTGFNQNKLKGKYKPWEYNKGLFREYLLQRDLLKEVPLIEVRPRSPRGMKAGTDFKNERGYQYFYDRTPAGIRNTRIMTAQGVAFEFQWDSPDDGYTRRIIKGKMIIELDRRGRTVTFKTSKIERHYFYDESKNVIRVSETSGGLTKNVLIIPRSGKLDWAMKTGIISDSNNSPPLVTSWAEAEQLIKQVPLRHPMSIETQGFVFRGVFGQAAFEDILKSRLVRTIYPTADGGHWGDWASGFYWATHGQRNQELGILLSMTESFWATRYWKKARPGPVDISDVSHAYLYMMDYNAPNSTPDQNARVIEIGLPGMKTNEAMNVPKLDMGFEVYLLDKDVFDAGRLKDRLVRAGYHVRIFDKESTIVQFCHTHQMGAVIIAGTGVNKIQAAYEIRQANRLVPINLLTMSDRGSLLESPTWQSLEQAQLMKGVTIYNEKNFPGLIEDLKQVHPADAAMTIDADAQKFIRQWNGANKQQRANMLVYRNGANGRGAPPYMDYDFLMYVLLDSYFPFRRTVSEIIDWGPVHVENIKHISLKVFTDTFGYQYGTKLAEWTVSRNIFETDHFFTKFILKQPILLEEDAFRNFLNEGVPSGLEGKRYRTWQDIFYAASLESRSDPIEIPVNYLLGHLSRPWISIQEYGVPKVSDSQIKFNENVGLAYKRLAIAITLIEKLTGHVGGQRGNLSYKEDILFRLSNDSDRLGVWSDHFDGWLDEVIKILDKDSTKTFANQLGDVLGDKKEMSFWECYFRIFILFKWLEKKGKPNSYQWFEDYLYSFLDALEGAINPQIDLLIGRIDLAMSTPKLQINKDVLGQMPLVSMESVEEAQELRHDLAMLDAGHMAVTFVLSVGVIHSVLVRLTPERDIWQEFISEIKMQRAMKREINDVSKRIRDEISRDEDNISGLLLSDLIDERIGLEIKYRIFVGEMSSKKPEVIERPSYRQIQEAIANLKEGYDIKIGFEKRNGSKTTLMKISRGKKIINHDMHGPLSPSQNAAMNSESIEKNEDQKSDIANIPSETRISSEFIRNDMKAYAHLRRGFKARTAGSVVLYAWFLGMIGQNIIDRKYWLIPVDLSLWVGSKAFLSYANIKGHTEAFDRKYFVAKIVEAYLSQKSSEESPDKKQFERLRWHLSQNMITPRAFTIAANGDLIVYWKEPYIMQKLAPIVYPIPYWIAPLGSWREKKDSLKQLDRKGWRFWRPVTASSFSLGLDKFQSADEAMNVAEQKKLSGPGGIDLNRINVKRTGKTINMQFDPAQLNELEQSNFKGFIPVITGLRYIQSPYALLGINNPAKEPEFLVKA